MSTERGAFSTGPMVPVLASNDEGRSRAILELLEDAGIPALLDLDLEGFVGLHEPVPDGWNQILVPSSMRTDALELLHQQDFEAPPKRPTSPAYEVPRPSARTPRQPNPLTETRRPAEAAHPGYGPEDDAEDDREVLRLPEPTEVRGRIQLALAAIAFGGVAQRGLAALFGDAAVIEHLAARQPILEEVHRLFTASFLHGGASHFISNAAFGLVFGVVLFGTHRVGATAFVWLLSSAIGLAAEVTLSPEAIVVGASAGNYGLVGLWARGQLQRSRLALLPRREALRTIGILLLLLPGALTPFSSTGTRIAVLAHLGGFLAGLLAGVYFERRLHPSGFDLIDARSRVAGVVAVSSCAAAWLVGVGAFW